MVPGDILSVASELAEITRLLGDVGSDQRWPGFGTLSREDIAASRSWSPTWASPRFV